MWSWWGWWEGAGGWWQPRPVRTMANCDHHHPGLGMYMNDTVADDVFHRNELAGWRLAVPRLPIVI